MGRHLASQLAGIFLRGEWSLHGLLRGLNGALGLTGRWARIFVGELMQEFPAAPFGQRGRLALAIQGNRRFRELVQRGQVRPYALRTIFALQAFTSSKHPVPRIVGARELAACLQVPAEWFDWFVDARGLHLPDEALNHYCRRWIPKASGGARLIEAPKQRLKAIQRRVLHGILDAVETHDAAHGCVAKRSAITHAMLHEGKQVVAQFDLQDFFTTLDRTRVSGLFRMMGYPRATAFWLASLCTTNTPAAFVKGNPRLQHRHLPQGAPTSPAIANLCAWSLDARLTGLAQKLGMTYSRYVDDLAFSSDGPINFASFRALVQGIVEDEGFILNPSKSRLQRASQQQRVTGLVVNRKAQVDRKEFDQLRATLHRAQVSGAVPFELREALLGQIAWASATSPTRRIRLMRSFDAIAWVFG